MQSDHTQRTPRGISRPFRPYLVVAAILGALIAVPPASGQITWYVDDDAPSDPGPGDPSVSDPNEDGSAAHPFDAIQEAVDAASDGDTVLVLDGSYSGDGNLEIEFRGKAITVRSANGPEQCTVVGMAWGAFVFVSDETPDTILDGFTIAIYGPDIVCDDSSPTITNCVITPTPDIRCTFGSPTITRCTISPEAGAAIWAEQCDLTIRECAIVGQRRSGEAAVCCSGGTLEIRDCTITNNNASWGASGAVCCQDTQVTITNCLIATNSAWQGGGIYCQGGSLTINGCTIDANAATVGSGGGVYCHKCDLSLTDSVILSNTAESNGGGVYCYEGTAAFTNCTISNNAAGSDGGGAYTRALDTIVTGCTFSGNAAPAGRGGGICQTYHCGAPPVTISECQIVANTASRGGGISCARAAVSDCTIRGNAAGQGGGALVQLGGTIADCLIAGNTAGEAGGILCSGTPIIIRCRIIGNADCGIGAGRWDAPLVRDCTIAANRASGIRCDDHCEPVVINCTVAGNGGYALSCGPWGEALVANCTLAGNFLGAASNLEQSPLTLVNCLVAGNTGTNAGRGEPLPTIEAVDDLAVANCTIVKNTTLGQGQAVQCGGEESVSTIANSILWANSRADEPEIVFGFGQGLPATLAVHHSLVYGGLEAVEIRGGDELDLQWGPGNLDTHPLFAATIRGFWTADPAFDPNTSQWMFTDASANWVEGELVGRLLLADGDFDPQFPIIANSPTTATVWADAGSLPPEYGQLGAHYAIFSYRLRASSPCVDAGCNCAVPRDLLDLDGDGNVAEYTPFDLDGEGRFFDDPNTPDSGSGVPPVVDIGAYEFGGSDPPPCFGDLDGDRDVDLDDLAVLLAHYGTTAGAGGADGDLDCDGDVELSDLAALLSVYGRMCQ